MKIIDKWFSEKNPTWDYYETIIENDVLYTRFNIIDVNHIPFTTFDWYEDEPDIQGILDDEMQIKLENEYKILLRKNKLKNILDENY